MLRILLHKEWRDQRLLAISALVVCVLFMVLGRLLGGTGFNAELRAEILPMLLAVFAILLATESIARDASSGVESTLARLPAARRVVWLSKAGLVALMTTGGGLLLVAIEWILRACEQRAAPTVSALAPQYLVFIAAIAAACFASACTLRRSLPAAFLGVLLVAIVPLVAWILLPFHRTEWIDVVLCAWTPTGLAAVGIAAFLLGSLFAFGTRHQDHFGLRRAARCALGGSLVLVPVFAGTPRSAAWAFDILPFSPTAKFFQVCPRPDGKFVALEVGQEWDPRFDWAPWDRPKEGMETRHRIEVWILDVRAGTVREIDRRFRMLLHSNAPVWDERGRLVALSTPAPFGMGSFALEHIDPERAEILGSRAVDLGDVLGTWYRRGYDGAITAKASGATCKVSQKDALLKPSATPGIVFSAESGCLVRRDVESGATTTLCVLREPCEHRMLLESPDRRWFILLEFQGKGPTMQRLLDACDGRLVKEFEPGNDWMGWSTIPGRICMVCDRGCEWSVLGEDGSRTPMPARGFDWEGLGLERPAAADLHGLGGIQELGLDRMLFVLGQRIGCMTLDGTERRVLYEAKR
jgi:hypothetical protein